MKNLKLQTKQDPVIKYSIPYGKNLKIIWKYTNYYNTSNLSHFDIMKVKSLDADCLGFQPCNFYFFSFSNFLLSFFSSTFYLLQYFYSPCSEVGWCLVIISCPGHVFIPNLRDDLADLQTEICLPCVTWIIKHDNICHDYKKRLLLSGRHACISLFRL